jgi:hypothetical protein
MKRAHPTCIAVEEDERGQIGYHWLDIAIVAMAIDHSSIRTTS